MVDFCHGQAHRSKRHHHLLLVSGETTATTNLLNLSQTHIEEGEKIELTIEDHSYTIWIVTPDFVSPSIIRRLIRTSDGIMLQYTLESIRHIENWVKDYQTTAPIISIVDDFDILEKMNKLHGTLTSPVGYKDSLIELFHK